LSAAPQLIVTLTTDQLADLVEASAARAVEKLVANQQQEVLGLTACATLLGRNEEVVMRVLVKKKGLPVHYISDREPRFKRSEILAWLDTLPSKRGGKEKQD
jgi:hypothetical protein